MLIKFERHHEPLLPRTAFLLRVVRNVFVAGAVVFFALGLGMMGYRFFGHLSWIDSLYNASMILTGMGPANLLPTTAGKLFASFYALFSGVVFITSIAVFLAPLVHRFLHHFHLEFEKEK